jgi:hypothetical protein
VRNMASGVKVKQVHQLIVSWRVMIGKVVPMALCAVSPVHVALALCYSILDPVILHVKTTVFFIGTCTVRRS